MVSITLSIPDDIKDKMEKFSEINWSGFVRKCIIEKTDELNWKEQMFEKIKKERNISDWGVKITRNSRLKRLEELKKKGLI